MSNERLLDYDPYTGIKTYFSSHGKGLNDWTYRYEFRDADPLLDSNLAKRNDPDLWRQRVKGGRVEYAHITDDILLKWHIMGVNINDKEELFKMVNRPEWSYLKTTNKVHVSHG